VPKFKGSSSIYVMVFWLVADVINFMMNVIMMTMDDKYDVEYYDAD
jgi:hypothetical protein